jgi:hypothetical protein
MTAAILMVQADKELKVVDILLGAEKPRVKFMAVR